MLKNKMLFVLTNLFQIWRAVLLLFVRLLYLEFCAPHYSLLQGYAPSVQAIKTKGVAVRLAL